MLDSLTPAEIKQTANQQGEPGKTFCIPVAKAILLFPFLSSKEISLFSGDP